MYISLCLIISFFLTACTISFQNISSVGKAQDMIDTAQEASPDVDANLELPVSPL